MNETASRKRVKGPAVMAEKSFRRPLSPMDHYNLGRQTGGQSRVSGKLPGALSRWSAVFFLAVVIAATQVEAAAQPPSPEDCSGCHNDIITAGLNKPYIHQPFMELQCTLCHVDDGRAAAAGKSSGSIKKSPLPARSIDWFDYTAAPAVESWFFVPLALFGKAVLVVSAGSSSGKNNETVLELPPVEGLPSKRAESKPPVIKDAAVQGVYRSVLISARISWSTDRMTDAEVRYGIDSLQYSASSDALATEHEIVLQNLKPDQVYQYLVISRDIFGNCAVSESGAFSTDKFSPPPPEKYEMEPQAEIVLTTRFFRTENAYLVNVTANQPVYLKIGQAAVFKKTGPAAAYNSGYAGLESSVAGDTGHLPLRNIDEIATEVCRKCHARMFGPGNHAVNVMPAGGMILPADYSTSSGGHITCITCHDPHGSDYEYITVASRHQDLCVGCHKGYDRPPGQRSTPLLMAGKENRGARREEGEFRLMARR